MKIKSKLTSMLLVVTTVLTSIGIQPLTAYAQTNPIVWNGGVAASSSADCRDLSIDDVGPALVPDVQMVRVTLMKTTETGDASGGFPVTAAELPNLVQNPIHMVPENYGAIWGSEITEHDIRSPKNIDPNRTKKDSSRKQGSVFNSRREYLGNKLTGNNTASGPSSPESYVLSYGCHLQGYNHINGIPQNYQWVFTDSKFTTQQIDKVFPDKCIGNVVDIGGNDEEAKAYYQKNPPVPEITSGMPAPEYFDAIAKAVFEENDPSIGINSGGAKQVFIYHIIADMLGYDDDPYCTEVETVVQDVMNRKYEILIEPMLTWDVRESKVLQTMFGAEVPYISMTAGDLTTEDAISTVYFGATSADSLAKDKDATVERNFNPITHGKTSKGYMAEFYKSLQLKDTDKRVNLHAVSDKEYFNGLFSSAISSAGKYGDKPEWSTNKTTNYNYGGKFKYGPLSKGQSGAYVENPFYGSVSYNLAQKGVDPSSVECQVDMAAMFNTGALYIIQPQFSTVNYTITAKGYGDDITYKTTPSGQKLPVYKSAFDGTNNKITINVQTRLKMDTEVIDPAQPKGTKWVDEVLVAEPTNYNTELPKSDGSGAYKVQPITSETAKAYIPGQTRSNITLYYADENGNPLESYTQINGTPGNRNSSIITKDESTGQYYKLFLDNVNYYAFNPQTNEPDTYQLSVSNCVDTNKMGDANIATASNVFSDSRLGETNWLDITIPSIEKRPTNAAYILVKATVNLGATQKHTTTTDSLSEQVAQSRPQQHLDSAGNLVNEYALAYPKDNPSPENAKAVGVVETIAQQNDNQIEFLIPIGKEYDLSADSISINHTMSPPAPNGSTTLLGIDSIKTISSATDETKEDFAGKETGEVLHIYATTDPTKAQEISDYFNDKRYDESNIESTHISNFDPTKGRAYSSTACIY